MSVQPVIAYWLDGNEHDQTWICCVLDFMEEDNWRTSNLSDKLKYHRVVSIECHEKTPEWLLVSQEEFEALHGKVLYG